MLYTKVLEYTFKGVATAIQIVPPFTPSLSFNSANPEVDIAKSLLNYWLGQFLFDPSIHQKVWTQ